MTPHARPAQDYPPTRLQDYLTTPSHRRILRPCWTIPSPAPGLRLHAVHSLLNYRLVVSVASFFLTLPECRVVSEGEGWSPVLAPCPVLTHLAWPPHAHTPPHTPLHPHHTPTPSYTPCTLLHLYKCPSHLISFNKSK